MCNAGNLWEIKDFFARNEFFGLPQEDVCFFVQSEMPTANNTGRVFLEERHRIAMHPNGSGDVFSAMLNRGVLLDLKNRGVEHIFVASQDNLLLRIADPVFLGFCSILKMSSGVKCVERRGLEDEGGVYCTRVLAGVDEDGDGEVTAAETRQQRRVPSVIEQRELAWEVLHQRSPHGSFALDALSLCQFYFHRGLCERVSRRAPTRWHAIRRRQPFVSLRTGAQISPPSSALNGVRLEWFVGEALEFTAKAVGLLVQRDAEWARAKHLAGASSAREAVFAMSSLHFGWICAHAGKFESTAGVDRGKSLCEISPLVTYGGEDLGGMFGGQVIRLPYHFESKVEQSTFVVASRPRKEPSVLFVDPWGTVERIESALLKAEVHKQKVPRRMSGGLGEAFAEMCLPNDSQELPATLMSLEAEETGSLQSSSMLDSSPRSLASPGSSARSPHSPHLPHQDDESESPWKAFVDMKAWKLMPNDIDDLDVVTELLKKERRKMAHLPRRSSLSCQDRNPQRHLCFDAGAEPGVSIFAKAAGYQAAPGEVPPPRHIQLRLREWDHTDSSSARPIWSSEAAAQARAGLESDETLPGHRRYQWVHKRPKGYGTKVDVHAITTRIVDAGDVEGQRVRLVQKNLEEVRRKKPR